MLQARITFDLLFSRGISPTEGKNQNYFSSIENMYPSEEGFKSFDLSDRNFLNLGDSFSKVFNCIHGSFLLNRDGIYKILEDGSLEEKLIGIDIGEKWTVADYETFFVFSNGIKTISLDSSGVFSYTNFIPQVKSLLNYNGQLVMANHSSDVKRFIPSLDLSPEAYKSLITFSSIGSFNCLVNEENIDAGFMLLTDVGEIFEVLKLGNEILVIGKEGVGVLYPFEHSFGKRLLLEFGARDKDSICVSKNAVYFIGKNGQVWEIESGPKIQAWGFGYVFKNLATKMWYEKERREVFIVNTNKTYVINTKGLFKLNGLITGRDKTGRYIYNSFVNMDSESFITSVLDFKDPGLKILEEISIGLNTETEVPISFRIHTREKVNGPWSLSPFYRVNNQNWCKPHVAGEEFKIEFLSSGGSLKIDWITVQYDKIDKRVNRGHQFVDINREG